MKQTGKGAAPVFAKMTRLSGLQAKAQTWFKTRVMASRKTQALFITVVAATAVVLGPVTVAAIGGGGSLPLIGFNEERAMGFEEKLVSLGPRWAGTPNEAAAADFIASEFTKAGLKDVKIEDFEEILWEVNTAEISIVPYGPLGLKPSLTQSPISFEHKRDFVVQGFSGSRPASNFRFDLLPFWVQGAGDNETDFSGGSGRVCIVEWKEASITGNWVLFNNSWNAGCAALLAHNQVYAPELNYTPISKGNPQPEYWPDPSYPDIPFAAISMDMGEQIRSHPSWKIRLNFDVSIGTRLTHVVTGDVKGTVDPSRFVMLGSHLDNVYVNNGAVDDGVGTTTIIELAHQLAGTSPKYTIRLAAFGAEEEGLLGSEDWRDAHAAEVNSSMIAMFQFDMNHVDLERCAEMYFTTNDNATISPLLDAERKVREATPTYSVYSPVISYGDTSRMGSDMAVFAAWGKTALFAHGCGSLEYHTYLDDINRVTMPSLGYSGRVFASVALWMANK